MCSPTTLAAEIRREFPEEYDPPPFELADIVRMHGDAYRAAGYLRDRPQFFPPDK